MTTANQTRSLTVALNIKEHDDLDAIVDFFQRESISTVSKSDVVKYLIRRYKFMMDNAGDEFIQSFERKLRELTLR